MRRCSLKIMSVMHFDLFVIYSSRIMSILNVNMLLLPTFIQKSHGLHKIIEKTPLK